jgi:hypothetical protein
MEHILLAANEDMKEWLLTATLAAAGNTLDGKIGKFKIFKPLFCFFRPACCCWRPKNSVLPYLSNSF